MCKYQGTCHTLGWHKHELLLVLLSESVSCSVVSDSLDSMDCSPPGSSVHGFLQARMLEWVAIPFSRGSSQSRDRTHVSHIAGGFFTSWATREAQPYKGFSHYSHYIGEETEDQRLWLWLAQLHAMSTQWGTRDSARIKPHPPDFQAHALFSVFSYTLIRSWWGEFSEGLDQSLRYEKNLSSH